MGPKTKRTPQQQLDDNAAKRAKRENAKAVRSILQKAGLPVPDDDGDEEAGGLVLVGAGPSAHNCAIAALYPRALVLGCIFFKARVAP